MHLSKNALFNLHVDFTQPSRYITGCLFQFCVELLLWWRHIHLHSTYQVLALTDSSIAGNPFWNPILYFSKSCHYLNFNKIGAYRILARTFMMRCLWFHINWWTLKMPSLNTISFRNMPPVFGLQVEHSHRVTTNWIFGCFSALF
jgi:hypothetical protein